MTTPITTAPRLTITRHAMDQVSQRCLHLWPRDKIGLFSWVEGIAREGFAKVLASVPAGVFLDSIKFDFGGMTFVVKDNKVVTVYLASDQSIAA